MRHRREHNHLAGYHVTWQASGAVLAQFALRRLLPRESPRKSEQLPIDDYHCSFRKRGMAEQRRFHISQLHAMPMNLDHVIAPAMEHQSPGYVKLCVIAGRIPARA